MDKMKPGKQGGQTRRAFIGRVGAAGGGLLGALATGGSISPALWGGSVLRQTTADRPTSVVLILTDNQGAWTLGCYGNPDIRTPNIDSLARGGMRFSRAYCSNPVCSPTRATVLTGLIPSQHGVHSFIRETTQVGPDAYNTIGEFRTLPKILSEAGYDCALTGKWHLGANLKPQEGFEYWFAKVQGGTSTFYNDDWIWDGKIYKEPRYTTDAITEHAVTFLEKNKERPFFLYLAYNAPYGLGRIMQEVHRNRHTEYYSDKTLDSFPREKISPWLFNNRDMINNLTSMRSYAAALSGLDDGVGRVMATLQRLGRDRDTLVIYTADNAWSGGHGGYWGMGDHTRPIGAREEMAKIPLIFKHPGRIPEGEVSDLMVANYDFLPTILTHLRLQDQIPSSPELPSRDFAAALKGEAVVWDNTVFYEYENTRMIRTEDWKLVLRYPDGPDELYDLKNNPREREELNLIHAGGYKEQKEKLTQRLTAFFERYADPRYDIWKGGRSKAARLTKAGSGSD